MSTFRFNGFTEGSSVAVTVTQGANLASGSVATWGQGNLASLDITTVAPPTLVAPSAVWFETTNFDGFQPGAPSGGQTYDPRLHEITFTWSRRGAAPGQGYDSVAGQNMATGWNDRNKAYGPRVCFGLDQVGDNKLDVTAIDGQDNTGVNDATVTLLDPDLVYPGARTVCFSNDPAETWAGEKSGCQRITSWSALQTAINDATEPLRVLFKRGQTYLSQAALTFGGEGCDYVATWGSGAKPIFDKTQISDGGATLTELRIIDIHFRGDYDPVSMTGPGFQPVVMNLSTTFRHTLLWGVVFENISIGYPSPRPNIGGVLTLVDFKVDGWQDYGLFIQEMQGPNSRIALLGVSAVQNVDARNGWDGTNADNNNNHGPLRIEGARNVHIACSDFFSRNGWTNVDQSPMRLNSNALSDSYYNVERTVAEGGSNIFGMATFSGGSAASPGNYIFDKVLAIISPSINQGAAIIQFAGLTIRNFIGLMPDVPQWYTNTYLGFFRLRVVNGHTAGNENNPVRIYSSSFINLRTSANDLGANWSNLVSNEGGFNAVVLENNVVHAPNINNPVTSNAPIDLATPITGLSPRYKGIWQTGDGSINTTYSSAGSPVPRPDPQNGSNAYQTATSGLVAYDDFFGTVRGNTPSRGAVEPNA